MPSINRIPRSKDRARSEETMLIAFFSAVMCCDSYVLSRTEEKGVELVAYKGVFKEKFAAGNESGILEPLGKWLCRLPKTVWDKNIK